MNMLLYGRVPATHVAGIGRLKDAYWPRKDTLPVGAAMNAVQQFSLRGLFFVTLVAAVFCWMYVALPPAFWATLLWMLVVSAMFSASIYGPGNVRAFAVGCLPALAWWAV